MPYQGWKKEEEETEKRASQQPTSYNEAPTNELTNNDAIPSREENERFEAQKRISDENIKRGYAQQLTDDPAVRQNLYNNQKQAEYYSDQGDYEKSREYADAYIKQLQTYMQDKADQEYRDMGLKSGDYQLERFQEQARKANATEYDALMRAIRGAYNRDNMPVRQKNIEPGGTGVNRGAEIPWREGDPGMAGGEAPWSPINYAYEQTPSGYNQFSYGDDFGDPFNAQQYPFVAQNLENPLSTLPEYIANYILPGMDHFPTQEELEQIYDTGLW